VSASNLQLGYFALFDINEDGELSPEEMERMVKVLLENNPTMSDVVTSDVVISKLVNEIFGVADDNGDGVLSLKEFLTHSKFITKKILLQNTSFDQRTKRLIKKIHGDSVNEISFTKYSSPAVELM
jgi:Ca2+-binding EF-hand superfamily protein